MAVFSGHIKGPCFQSNLRWPPASLRLRYPSSQGGGIQNWGLLQTPNLEILEVPLVELQQCSWDCSVPNHTRWTWEPWNLYAPVFPYSPIFTALLEPKPCCLAVANPATYPSITLSGHVPPDGSLYYSEPFAASLPASLETLVWPFPKLETRLCHLQGHCACTSQLPVKPNLCICLRHPSPKPPSSHPHISGLGDLGFCLPFLACPSLLKF